MWSDQPVLLRAISPYTFRYGPLTLPRLIQTATEAEPLSSAKGVGESPKNEG